MSDAEPGWYADPSGQADLRWWDGRSWTASTRPHADPAAMTASTPSTPPPPAPPPPPPTPPGPASFASSTPAPPTPSWELPTTEQPAAAAPFAAPGATAPFAAAGAAVPEPPRVQNPATSSPAVDSPGSFANWGGAAAPTASAAAGWAAAPPGPGPGGGGGGGDEGGPRSWLPWALTGAGVALIVVLIGFMAVSILGSSSTPSSSGLSAAGSSTTTTPTSSKPGTGSSTPSSASTTTIAPTTTTLPLPPGTPKGPPGSVLYVDPGGTYSISVGGSWPRAKSLRNGIPAWYIPAVPGGSRATFDVTSETLTYSIGLSQYVALTEEALRTQSSITQLGTDNITLADGVPAARIRYEAVSNQGVRLEGLAVIAVGSSDAYVVTVVARPDSADTMFAVASPYMRTLHVEN